MKDAADSYIAMLLPDLGKTYAVLEPNSGVETVFRAGKGVPISEEMKKYLEATALDTACVDEGHGKKSHRIVCKFSFAPISQANAP